MKQMNNDTDWIDFGSEKEKAQLDAIRLSGALGNPVYLAFNGEKYYCIPAVKLVGKEIPKEAELIGSRH